MSASRFPRFASWILRIEGGYADDPADRGGPTYAGLTVPALVGLDIDGDGKADFDFDHDGDVDADDIRALRGRPDREHIVAGWYRTQIWERFHADTLPWATALYLADMAVHSGPGPATLALQRALNAVAGGRGRLTEDGKWGPATAQAAMVTSSPLDVERLREWYHVERQQLFHRLCIQRPANERFFRGWTRRLFLLGKEAAA